MTTIVIHPCPFCGYVDVEVGEVSPNVFAIGCPECEAIGPLWSSVGGAINLWNERTPHAWNDNEGPL